MIARSFLQNELPLISQIIEPKSKPKNERTRIPRLEIKTTSSIERLNLRFNIKLFSYVY